MVNERRREQEMSCYDNRYQENQCCYYGNQVGYHGNQAGYHGQHENRVALYQTPGYERLHVSDIY